MSDHEGPTVVRTEHLSCIGCRHLERRLVSSGRKPVYESNCLHPDSDTPRVLVAQEFRRPVGSPLGRYIGTLDRTPDWCPVSGERQEP